MKTATKTLLIFSAIVCFSLLRTERTQANGGPHGNYTVLTDACAGCHRAHTAVAPKLLIEQGENLCLTCHGAGMGGANTDVENGVYTVTGDPLLGGGFVNYQGSAVSSTHSIDGTHQNAWGSGTTWSSTYDCAGCHNAESGLVWPGAPQWGISPGAMDTFPGRGQNVTMPLTCTSCHDPHGGVNYRLLQQRMHPPSIQQQKPAGSGLVGVTSNEVGGENPDQAGYVADYTTPNYKLGMGDWCTGCHFTYHQEVSARPFNAEDGQGLITRYRHKMNVPITGGTYNLTTSLPLEDPSGDGPSADDQIFCLTCHFGHGSNSLMTGFAANVAPAYDNTLLRADNRGVCQDCHKK